MILDFEKAEQRRNNIEKSFGITEDIEMAGWLFPDGRMVDMSDGEGGRFWYWWHDVIVEQNTDESEVEFLYEFVKDDCGECYNPYSRLFMMENNIRLVPDAPGIAVFHDIKITREQKMRLRELIRLAKRENREGVHNGIFYIDLYDEKGVSATGKLNINTLSVSEIVEYIEFQKIS